MPDPRPRFKSLLSPEDCALLLVDCSLDDHDGLRTRLGALLQLARSHGVPVLMVWWCARDANECFTSSCHTILRACANPLDDPDVCRTLSIFRRSRLLIGGGHADTCLAFAALSGLELGYDIYLLRDFSWGASASLCETAAARMMQAGVVPVSVSQVICEWQRDLRPEARGIQEDIKADIAGAGKDMFFR